MLLVPASAADVERLNSCRKGIQDWRVSLGDERARLIAFLTWNIAALERARAQGGRPPGSYALLRHMYTAELKEKNLSAVRFTKALRALGLSTMRPDLDAEFLPSVAAASLQLRLAEIREMEESGEQQEDYVPPHGKSFAEREQERLAALQAARQGGDDEEEEGATLVRSDAGSNRNAGGAASGAGGSGAQRLAACSSGTASGVQFGFGGFGGGSSQRRKRRRAILDDDEEDEGY